MSQICFPTDDDVAMLIPTEQHHIIGRLQAGANQGDVARHIGICRSLGAIQQHRKYPTTPAKDRYIRLMHLWVWAGIHRDSRTALVARVNGALNAPSRCSTD